jgi:hypothetical protein
MLSGVQLLIFAVAYHAVWGPLICKWLSLKVYLFVKITGGDVLKEYV